MFAMVIILIIVVAFLLILVILAQNSKGGGLSSQFGGSGTSQLMGVKKTGDLLEKLTWGLAIVLIGLTLSTKLIIPKEGEEGYRSPNIERAQESASPALEIDDASPASDDLEGALDAAGDSAQ